MTVAHDDNYLARNERSKAWATRDKEPWTPEEEARLLVEWPSRQQEEDVSRALGRTIAACRQRYSNLTAKGTRGPYRPQVIEVCVQVCTGCWTALPCTGVCDNCEEG